MYDFDKIISDLRKLEKIVNANDMKISQAEKLVAHMEIKKIGEELIKYSAIFGDDCRKNALHKLEFDLNKKPGRPKK